MKRNWRGHAARLHTFFDLGEGFFVKAKGMLVIGAALKILGLPLWALAVGTPFLIVAYIVAGALWMRYGWQRQLKEVSMVETWQPLDLWQVEMQCRILRHLQIETNHFDASRLPDEIARVLASAKKN